MTGVVSEVEILAQSSQTIDAERWQEVTIQDKRLKLLRRRPIGTWSEDWEKMNPEELEKCIHAQDEKIRQESLAELRKKEEERNLRETARIENLKQGFLQMASDAHSYARYAGISGKISYFFFKSETEVVVQKLLSNMLAPNDSFYQSTSTSPPPRPPTQWWTYADISVIPDFSTNWRYELVWYDFRNDLESFFRVCETYDVPTDDLDGLKAAESLGPEQVRLLEERVKELRRRHTDLLNRTK